MGRRLSKLQVVCILSAVAVLVACVLGIWVLRAPILSWWQDTWTSLGGDGGQTLPEDAVQFHFVDVGQGDCLLMITPWGNVLVDAGSNASEEQLRNYLNDRNVTDVALVVLTHADEDHIGGADMVMEEYDVAQVLMPATRDESLAYRRVRQKMESRGILPTEAEAGMTYWVGEVRFDVLAPLPRDYDDQNNAGAVIKVTYGGATALLTGDAGHEAEADLLATYGEDVLHCHLLKVGHHGADTSSSEAFLRAVSPRFAVISAGSGNPYDHPRAVVLERLELLGTTVYRTDRQGSVVLATDGGTWYVRT